MQRAVSITATSIKLTKYSKKMVLAVLFNWKIAQLLSVTFHQKKNY